MTFKVDYHIHTTYSDGQYTPLEIVKKYKEDGYRIIAITDHDGVGGVKEAQLAGKALDIKVVAGVELSSIYKVGNLEAKLHILGYNIDIENEHLLEVCRKLSTYREERNEKVFSYLTENGYPMDLSDVDREPGEYVGRPDIVRAIKKKYKDLDKPNKIISKFPKESIASEEAIRTVTQAGGIPVLAHPYKIRELKPKEEGFLERFEPVLKAMVGAGLKGIECFHPSATHEEALSLVEYAEKYHLHITYGSDFHRD